jgi:phosphoribosyl-ATP pyrophosphohydrolase
VSEGAPPLAQVLEALEALLRARRGADPKRSYTASLYAAGADAILKKIGEEAAEVLLAAKNPDRSQLVHELADLWFHTLVLMTAYDVPLSALGAELARRMGHSGLEEKAARGKA